MQDELAEKQKCGTCTLRGCVGEGREGVQPRKAKVDAKERVACKRLKAHKGFQCPITLIRVRVRSSVCALGQLFFLWCPFFSLFFFSLVLLLFLCRFFLLLECFFFLCVSSSLEL